MTDADSGFTELRALLDDIRRYWSSWNSDGWCSECERDATEGHRDDCALAAIDRRLGVVTAAQLEYDESHALQELLSRDAEWPNVPRQRRPHLTADEAATVLGVSRSMVLRWIREGLLDVRETGTEDEIPVASVEALVEARRSAGRPTAELMAAAEAGDPAAASAVAAARDWARERIAERDALPPHPTSEAHDAPVPLYEVTDPAERAERYASLFRSEARSSASWQRRYYELAELLEDALAGRAWRDLAQEVVNDMRGVDRPLSETLRRHVEGADVRPGRGGLDDG